MRSTEMVRSGDARHPGGGDREEIDLANVTREGFETCLAFGTASLAVADVVESLRHQVPDGPTGDLLPELEAAHHHLRDLFDLCEDAVVYTLALSVLVQAARTTEAIREDRNRPD